MSSRSPRSQSSRSPRPQSSRSQSSRSQTPTPRLSRSQSLTPSRHHRHSSSKARNLLMIYAGLAAFFLFAIISSAIASPKITKISPECNNFRNSTIKKDSELYKKANSLLKENITKIDLVDELLSSLEDVVEPEQIDEAIKALLYFEDDNGLLHSCITPIDTTGFFYVAVLLFLIFAILAGYTYFNQQRKTD